ncbi:MAG: methyl-accepting chemotaxis protein [Spirochaetaceae bacterium]|jgi:methyl-accepting chemotaxis protein|nr:methyl-accepting chemotaxis protein [Spirochaetaceae bacterium]
MKLRIKLSVIVSILTATVVATISVITLTQSSKLQTRTATENLTNIAGKTAMDIQRRCEQYLYAARTTANIMGNYDIIEEEDRRTRYDDMLYGLLKANPHFVSIYTLWKPNSLDNLDGDYGQYLSMYTQANGKIEYQTYQNPQHLLNNLSRQEIIGEPFSQTVNGKPAYVISIAAPVFNGDQQPVGFVGIDVNLTVLQSVAEIKPFDSGEVMVFSHSGINMVHQNPSLIGSSLTQEFTAIFGSSGAAQITGSLKTGKDALFQYEGREVVTFPFYVGSSADALTAVASVPVKTVLSPVHLMRDFTIILAGVAILITAAVSSILAKGIVKPILGVISMLKDISEGEGDLTKRINLTSRDEIGDMAHYFNLTLEKIRSLIVVIKEQSVSLADIGSELSGNMTNTAAAMNEISENIQSINGQVRNQARSVSETGSTMQDITQSIEQLNEHIENQSSNIAHSSSSIEEMIANITSVTQTLIHNVENVRHLASASELGHSSLQEVSTDIQEIAKESEGLLEITAVMENIASQTNLLSMNAAIEAAHAGESGKGFAVVADEIRKLAESSGEQSNTIAEVLKKIKNSIDKIMESTDAVLNRFEAIDSGVKLVSEQEESIRNAMEEQQTGGQQVLDVIARLNDITQQVRQGSSDMLKGSKKIITESDNLERLTAEVSNGVAEMSKGAGQVNAAVDRVNNLSNDNKDHIDTLVTEISKFKVD